MAYPATLALSPIGIPDDDLGTPGYDDWMSDDPTAKVLFRVPSDGDPIVETLWAIPLGNDLYKLDNSPFYAYSVSWQDVVFAPYDEEEDFPTFESVVERSGNRTVRICFETPVQPDNASDQILQGLVALGCSYEGAHRKYIAINIPPAVELAEVRSYLCEREADWEHADPTYDELFPEGE
jgi:hypothetical protein